MPAGGVRVRCNSKGKSARFQGLAGTGVLSSPAFGVGGQSYSRFLASTVSKIQVGASRCEQDLYSGPFGASGVAAPSVPTATHNDNCSSSAPTSHI